MVALKKSSIVIFAGLLVVLAILLILITLSLRSPAQVVRKRINGINTNIFIQQCQNIIAYREKYKKYYCWTTNSNPRYMRMKLSLCETSGEFSKIKPVREIWLHEDHLSFNLHAFPDSRVNIVVYSPDANETGTVKIAEGMWYWGGEIKGSPYRRK